MSNSRKEFDIDEERGADRIIYPLKARRPVRVRFVVFDTETKVLHESEFSKARIPARKIALRYMFARLHNETSSFGSQFESEVDQEEKTQKRRFTKWLVSLARQDNHLTVWAHNAMYDTCAALDFGYLSRGDQDFAFEHTFISSHPFIFKIRCKPKRKDAKEILIRILDTYSFYKYSLERLAPYFGMQKVAIDFEAYARRRLDVPAPLLMKRCKSDVRITEAIVQYLYSRMRGKIAVSAPQLAYNTFRTMMSSPIEKLGGLAIESYHGGRTEIFKRLTRKYSVRLDVNSMYPWAMCQPLPVRHGWSWEPGGNPNVDQIIRTCKSGKYLATIRATVNIPPRYIGPFPYWDGHKLLFPTGRFETIINSPEFMALDSHKFIEKVHEATVFKAAPFLEGYSRKFYHEKLKASQTKDMIGREYNKLLLNSLFGKFGQKQKETRPLPDALMPLVKRNQWTGVEDVQLDMDYPDEGLLKDDVIHCVFIAGQPVYSVELDFNISPALASFITSYARARLYEFMETRAGRDLFYVDTDCLVVPE